MISFEDKMHNTKLYPIYKMFGTDLLFFYAIIFIFYTQIKGFDASQILFLDALSSLYTLCFNIPATSIVEKIGLKKSLILGNLLMCVFIVILIFAPNIYVVAIASLFHAFSFTLKRLTESNILAETVDVESEEGKYMFSIIESVGTRNYELLDGITSFFTGITFLINPYFPILITLIFQITATLLSTNFRGISNNEGKTEKKRESLIADFIEIIKSKRIQSILLFMLLFEGTLFSTFSLRETMLVESLNIETSKFSIIIAILTIIGGIMTILQRYVHKLFRNKSLTFLGIIYVLTMIVAGLVALSSFSYIIKLIVILLLFTIEYAFRDIYLILIISYSKNFTTKDIRVKVTSVVEAVKNISNFSIALIASLMLNIWSIEYTFLYMGLALLILLLLSLSWMKKHFGLSPEQYSEKDIFQGQIN